MNFFKFLLSKVFVKQLLIAFVIVLVLIFGLKFWLGITTNHDQKIQVPDLKKMSLSEVEAKLQELDLDYKVIDSAVFNPKFPKKSVLEQEPVAGSFVKEKRKIYLTLNPSKYANITIPDLNGKTKRQAITHLKSIGFVVGNAHLYIPDIGRDVVRGILYKGKKLEVGTKIAKKSELNLVLGDGTGKYIENKLPEIQEEE